jgi:hypothetical protein
MNTFRFPTVYSLALLVIGIPIVANVFDNAHFYRATYFTGEPRLCRSSYTTFDFTLAGGFSDRSRDACGCKVPLWDLYGPSNMHELGVNVPNQDLSNPFDLTLKNLALSPSRDCFANYSITSDFHILEWYFDFRTNILKGFFFGANLPMRKFQITHPCLKDLSSTSELCPNSNTPIWQQFKSQFDGILNRYCLSADPIQETSLGDLTLSVGWAYSYNESDQIDYVDVDLQAGVLFPTGKLRNEDKIFSLPFGYNGHYGFPVAFDLAFGTLEWVTIGGGAQGIAFASSTRNIRLRTAPHQSGIITLAKGYAKVSPGPLFIGTAYVKADHFARGFSLLIGYNYTKKNADKVSPCDPCFCNETVASNYGPYLPWHQHTLNIVVDYDFSREEQRTGMRLSFFYNAHIDGERVFATNMAGTTIGIEMLIDF